MGPLIWATVALAEPVALRAPVEAPVAVALGTRSASIAADVGPLALAVDVGWDGRAVGVAAGRRTTVVSGGPWRWDAGAAVGVVVLPVARTVGLTLLPFTSVGLVGGRSALVATVAVPAALSREGLRLPLSAELAGGPRLGPVWVTPRLAAGPVWTPGLDVALAAEVGLVVATAR